ncbi:PhnD/SsuA/transferrin family substrate-binding protein [Halegenticoccus tardaugens]|uniref:PhnD/SsuA/transferrin family substrate-binding protein n=1 Tax=Halegenticoccus tardaugens TaxID=2071624 RepID=UPI001E51606D|nr:PhnD/SsuA/transferrin family substrate-binding protein [Halegenticoccus tardaugens]
MSHPTEAISTTDGPTTGTDADRSSAGDATRIGRRRYLVGAGAAAVATLSGCTESLGMTGGGGETVTVLLTPDNPSEVQKDYEPMMNYLNEEVDGAEFEARVPTDYSAILPALKSEKAEIGMDDITMISAPEELDVLGTTVAGGTAFYFSMMLTRDDTGVEEPADMEGKTMAFADPLSTSGSLYAVYELKRAGLDIGEAPGSDEGADFDGNWSDHQNAVEQVLNEEADACCTWGGNGMRFVPEDQLTDEVKEKSAFVDEAGSEDEQLTVVTFSEPIPNQPVYARASWDSPIKDEMRDRLLALESGDLDEYTPDDYDGEIPFERLKDTTEEDYQPVIDVVDELGIDLTQE